jgi:hypothetical protein
MYKNENLVKVHSSHKGGYNIAKFSCPGSRIAILV